MIEELFFDIIALIIKLVAMLLTPIDNIILSILPDLSNAFTGVGSLFSIIGGSIGWVISLTGLSSASIGLIIMFYTFKLTAPLLFYTIKLAISWYNKLKL